MLHILFLSLSCECINYKEIQVILDQIGMLITRIGIKYVCMLLLIGLYLKAKIWKSKISFRK
ncbi:hypothetical protein SR1949_18020 [Sphaerospermopsis reniformis]|jgi:hypothetical protein|uniref:Uncharacterized protein n=1 Tax=Sphaerospermopsis reniformis TaxID=531300 RepID=A0A479ZYM2_9CYAN|nr:hypothetical protein NIES73_42910 [Sphaerospermopsis kisseleviana NIES-73]GCL36696.1 hypothetical protein SR1949_18020 [Sphaerospermopsis reniformis]